MDRVVFACRHNAGRSQMAAAFFARDADLRHHGRDLGMDVRARSGAGGDGFRAPGVGIDLGGARPRRLTPELAAGASLLVTMGCGEECPYLPGVEVQDWPLEDPKGQPLDRVREIRDDVQRRVGALLASRGWARSTDGA
jgi:arsenate reductase